MDRDFVTHKNKTIRKNNTYSLNISISQLKNATGLFKIILRFLAVIKWRLVSRMFWGRSVLYKNIVHSLMIGTTILFAVSGIASRIAVADENTNLEGTEIIGQNDLLPQGGSLKSVLKNATGNINSFEHIVKAGENLDSIAKTYNISTDTILGFNKDIINPFVRNVQEGWKLKIPSSDGKPINGVLYTVKKGQTLKDVINETSPTNEESNEFNIVQFNNLPEPYVLTAGQQLFIPDGNLKFDDIQINGIPRGVFINPLSDPGCNGYSYSRGFTFYHNGVDLARWPGCNIVAVAAGTISYAGSETLSGLTVKIDHGGGISTYYYHTDAIYVKVGQRVRQGDVIAMMGNSGNSTGTHLHFTLLKDGVAVNPYGYVPY